jgi:CHASE2 domain-containing sensor protein
MGYLERLQVATLDLLQRLGAQRFPPEIVTVAIDDAAFAGLGARQPIPRDYLARVVRGLERSGAAAVGLDITLTTPTRPADDATLAQAIREFGRDGVSRVVLVDEPPPPSGALAEPLRCWPGKGTPHFPSSAWPCSRMSGSPIPGLQWPRPWRTR